jgi:hypothetical protein
MLRRRRLRVALRDIEDRRLQDRVVQVFDEAKRRVESEGVDLIILCARRLPCLYQVLLRAGYEPISGALVVSDRFMDIVRHWRWRNVLILDDTVVLGTTLTKLHNEISARVKSVGGGEVRCAAICVDADKKADYLLNRLSLDPSLELSTGEVEQFSTDVVTTLFRNGIPFFSDFPVTRRIEMDRQTFLDFVDGAGWHVADVTAPLIATERQRAYTQIPDSEKSQETLAKMPPPVARLIEAFKLRSYVSPLGDQRLGVTFVPIALLGACRETDLDEALVSLSDMLGVASLEKIDWRLLSGGAKHRLLQMIASAFVLALVAEPVLTEALGFGGRWLDEIYASLYFGSMTDLALKVSGKIHGLARSTKARTDSITIGGDSDIPVPSELLADNDLRALLWAQRELFRQVRIKRAPDTGEMTKVGIVASHAISSLFGYISDEFETPQQAEIRALEDYESYVQIYGDDPSRRVLNQALTMRELASAILGDSSSAGAWDRALVSLGIDIANDLGIVVPSTQVDRSRGLVYRAYRLGETAQLAQRPLVRWQPDDGIDALDAFSQAIRDGYPILSQNVKLSLPVGSGQRAYKAQINEDDVVDELAKLLHEALPGRIVACFDGLITRVRSEGSFEAELTNILDFDISQAVLSTQQVLETQKHLVRPGVTFEWIVFERVGDDHKDRTSRLRLEEIQPLDSNAIERAAQDFHFLADAE